MPRSSVSNRIKCVIQGSLHRSDNAPEPAVSAMSGFSPFLGTVNTRLLKSVAHIKRDLCGFLYHRGWLDHEEIKCKPRSWRIAMHPDIGCPASRASASRPQRFVRPVSASSISYRFGSPGPVRRAQQPRETGCGCLAVSNIMNRPVQHISLITGR